MTPPQLRQQLSTSGGTALAAHQLQWQHVSCTSASLITSSTSAAPHQLCLQLVSGIASAMVLAHLPQWHHFSYVGNIPTSVASHQLYWQRISLSGITSATLAASAELGHYRSYVGAYEYHSNDFGNTSAPLGFIIATLGYTTSTDVTSATEQPPRH